MKATLCASLHDDSWVDRLPWVMLGLRTTPKEDFQTSPAELVYGQPLRVPRNFLPRTTCPWSASQQRSALLDDARVFAPVPTAWHGLPRSHILPGLQAAAYVFVLHDAHRGPLQLPYELPYDGPFQVLEPGVKFIVVDVGGKPDRISVGRLKPAHVDLEGPIVVAQPQWRGRSPAARPPPSAPNLADRSHCGRTLWPPRCLDLSVLVNFGGACVGAPNSSIIHC